MWVGLTLRKPSCCPPCAGPPSPAPRLPRRVAFGPAQPSFVPLPLTRTVTHLQQICVFYDACRRVLGRLLHPRSRVLLVVVVIVIVAVVLLLVTAVCKRACDRLSYAMLVTSSRRTLRYLVRERKKEHARMRACTHAAHTGRQRFRARSIGTAIQIPSVSASPEQARSQIRRNPVEPPGNPPRFLSSLRPPLSALRSGDGSAGARDTRYMWPRRAAQPAGRLTCVRWRARISARPNASGMRARPTNTTHL